MISIYQPSENMFDKTREGFGFKNPILTINHPSLCGDCVIIQPVPPYHHECRGKNHTTSWVILANKIRAMVITNKTKMITDNIFSIFTSYDPQFNSHKTLISTAWPAPAGQ